jgi:hypothetical protein
MQEVGCEEDVQLLEGAVKHLNQKFKESKFTYKKADKGTGAQDLKVATIYNESAN